MEKQLEKQFLLYNEALLFKELGFSQLTLAHFANGHFTMGLTSNSDKRDYESVATPLWQQAFEWFRTEHKIFVNVSGNNYYTCFGIVEPKMEVLSYHREGDDNYGVARLACLKKLIEMVKK